MQTTALSPMRVGRGHYGDARGTGIIIEAFSGDQPLALFLANRGFAGVGLDSLKRLCSMCDIEVPSGGENLQELLCMRLMMHFLEDLTENDAVQKLMYSAFLQEGPMDIELGEVTDEFIYDFMLCGEQREVISLAKDHALNTQVRENARSRAVQVARATFAKAASMQKVAKGGRPKRETKAAAASRVAEQAAVEKTSQRFYADLKKDPTQHLLNHSPPLAKVFVDKYNGRFQVSLKGYPSRSFSWTLRGEEEASRMALAQLWRWHKEKTDEDPPAFVLQVLGM